MFSTAPNTTSIVRSIESSSFVLRTLKTRNLARQATETQQPKTYYMTRGSETHEDPSFAAVFVNTDTHSRKDFTKKPINRSVHTWPLNR